MASRKTKTKAKTKPAPNVRTPSARGRQNREKGAIFEREIATRFTSYLVSVHGRNEETLRIKRNIGQARDGGCDIDIGCLVVEAKRRRRLTGPRKWLQQAQAAAKTRFDRDSHVLAGELDHIPIVVAREDGADEPMVVLGLNHFIILAGARVNESLDRDAL